jgi:hypothetical protein
MDNKLQNIFQTIALQGEFFADYDTALRAAELALACSGHNHPGFANMVLTKSHLEIGEYMPKTAWANEPENRGELDGWDMESGSAILAPFPDGL